MEGQNNPNVMHELKRLMLLYDKDKDQTIDKKELKPLIKDIIKE
eukprot:CAMPEP_0202972194 /NCGR_PEP_ID=MMETSP1396-20130829/34198_1 /ASSEMBLY_ACC=CAM_ASM_000872 /TAXON_ID= /ORGANISM="Pseudokeronopsis sp., Strain Brazil" /LENGTH=43 /DNA_ID= /DNA_START= /DNA_END= /DNA_ORIENTATION=